MQKLIRRVLQAQVNQNFPFSVFMNRVCRHVGGLNEELNGAVTRHLPRMDNERGRRDIYIHAQNEIRNNYDRVQTVENFIS